MRVVFFSNFLNHHQLPLCQALHKLTKGKFVFVATIPMPEVRAKLGYEDMNRAYPFVLCAYEGSTEQQLALQLAEEADVVIRGSAPWSYLEKRLKQKKLTFLYSERIYKGGYQQWKWPVRVVRFYKQYGRHSSLYLLCASAYTAYDFSRTYTFLGKTYKWGYFPAIKTYDVDALLANKRPNSILWAGRYLDLKHPEQVVEVAKRLKAEGYDFSLTMLGNGELLEKTRQQVAELGLQDRVKLPGAVTAEEVRGYMEEAGIYLFTSDRNEGWGAVLNESMNAGCAVVACSAIGSVPFLIQHGKNGLVYDSGDVEGLYQQVKSLMDHPEKGRALGRAAYETMTEQWNAELAAERLLNLSEMLLEKRKKSICYEEGPCSRAKILRG